MGRTPMIAGNWKMFKTSGEGAILVQNLEELVSPYADRVDVVCARRSPHSRACRSSSNSIGWTSAWPLRTFTGRRTVRTRASLTRMLKELRCGYCVVGHSERREMFGDTNETVNKKVRALFEAGITPIMCCGESLETRDAGETDAFVREQVRAGLEGITAEQAATIVIAYEPIWAIGTGRTPTPRRPTTCVAASAPPWARSSASPQRSRCACSTAVRPSPRTSACSCPSPTSTALWSAGQRSTRTRSAAWSRSPPTTRADG